MSTLRPFTWTWPWRTSWRAWLRGGFFVAGALLVLLMAIYANNFANYLVAGGLETSGAEALWYGEQHKVFDDLFAKVKGAKIDADAIAATIAAAVPVPEGTDPPEIEGLYVLMPEGAAADAVPYGTGAVALEGEEYVFAAALADGTEIRGWATKRSSGLLTAEASRAGAKQGSTRFGVYGYAQRDADGYFNGFGQREEADESEHLMPFVAYRLP